MMKLSKEGECWRGWLEICEVLTKMLLRREAIRKMCEESGIEPAKQFPTIFKMLMKGALKVTFQCNEQGEPTDFGVKRAEQCPVCWRDWEK